MTKQLPEQPENHSLSRFQILFAMALTAIILLAIAKLWLYFGSVELLPLVWRWPDLLWGLGLGAVISLGSSSVYRLWPAYRQSADVYLELVLKPLAELDLIWLGLLPGMSEELLFRGVMLPALGLNRLGVVVSSLCFGILHLSGRKQWPYVIWATIVGLGLGFSALVSQNLLVPITAHVLTNVVSGYLWKLGKK